MPFTVQRNETEKVRALLVLVEVSVNVEVEVRQTVKANRPSLGVISEMGPASSPTLVDIKSWSLQKNEKK